MSTRSVFTSFVILATLATPTLSLGATSRTTISLNGKWQIEDSRDGEAIPVSWNHKVAVPGLAHSAEPAFPQVDQFDSRMLIQNRVSQGKLPKTALVYNAGVSRQERNWFWYRRTFEVSETKSAAILRINKAQFGAAVWLNGVKIGDHLPCFTAAIFDVTKAIRRGENELIVRVGAHPGVLPVFVSGGTDFEKIRWTPGIYDNVSLALSENPVIETVQIASDTLS
jgi:beta-galactosidase/beta-glucuronidase